MTSEPSSSSSRAPLKTIRELAPNSFIFVKENALPSQLCRSMIARFEEASAEHYEGRVGQMIQKDRSIKKSTDLVISGKPHWKDIDQALFQSLGRAMGRVREKFPFFKGRFKGSAHGLDE